MNVCLNAIHAGSVDADTAKWRITQGMLELEIGKARAAKEEHWVTVNWNSPRSSVIGGQ